MEKNIFNMASSIIIILALIGCASVKKQTVPEKPELPDTDMAEDLKNYVSKVDNFIIILDTSGSMSDPHEGKTRFQFSKQIISRMNQMIPDIKLVGALRIFGKGTSLYDNRLTSLIYWPVEYETSKFEEALNTVKWAAGDSMLSIALDAAAEDIKNLKGRTALIIVTDGKIHDADSSVASAESLKRAFGDRLCIYAVHIATRFDDIHQNAEYRKIIDNIVAAGECGFSVSSENVASDSDMQHFVEQIFLAEKIEEKATEPIARESEAPKEYEDIRPHIPQDRSAVLMEEILFSPDKSDIHPIARQQLDSIAAFLQNNLSVKLELYGHTDNIEHSAQDLSEKRARNVMEYLLKKGVASDRISAQGFGSTRYRTSNESPVGQAANRRVEIKIVKNEK